jgi:uncharacterized protein
VARNSSSLFQDLRAPLPGWVAPVGVGVALVAIGAATLAETIVDSAGGGPAASLVAAATVLYGAMLAFCFLVARRAGGLTGWRRALGASLHFGDLGPGVVYALAARGAALMAAAVVASFTDRDTSGNRYGFDDYEWDTAVVVILVVIALVVAPVVEELFFRGALQGSFDSLLPVSAAITLTSLLFGISHLSVDLGPASVSVAAQTAAAGAVFGVAVHRSHRLGQAMIAHFGYNLIGVAVAFAIA